MKNTVIAVMTLIMTGAAQAAIPQLNYECPGQIQFHSDEGGPVYINGQGPRSRSTVRTSSR